MEVASVLQFIGGANMEEEVDNLYDNLYTLTIQPVIFITLGSGALLAILQVRR